MKYRRPSEHLVQAFLTVGSKIEDSARARIESGLREYHRERAYLRAWLKGDVTRSGADFDREFATKSFTWGCADDSFMLGDLYQGDWARWLHLLQIMVEIGEAARIVRGRATFYFDPSPIVHRLAA